LDQPAGSLDACQRGDIGSAFYFIALDAGLRANPRLDPRVKGGAWQMHGGGFYNIQKYSVAPHFMPEHPTWFKWEAYATWILGFALIVPVYYLNPTVYLIDTSVMNIDVAERVHSGRLDRGCQFPGQRKDCRRSAERRGA
jgi:uncharacterized membrane protein